MKRGTQFAFARPASYDPNGELVAHEQEGLTVREYMATEAMKVLLTPESREAIEKTFGLYGYEVVCDKAADMAVMHADALMKKLGSK